MPLEDLECLIMEVVDYREHQALLHGVILEGVLISEVNVLKERFY